MRSKLAQAKCRLLQAATASDRRAQPEPVAEVTSEPVVGAARDPVAEPISCPICFRVTWSGAPMPYCSEACAKIDEGLMPEPGVEARNGHDRNTGGNMQRARGARLGVPWRIQILHKSI
jgi:hypothetical protein